MTAEEEGRVAAEQFRQEHGLGYQPLGDLVTVVEQATGIDVAVLDVGPDEHGMTMRDSVTHAVFIAVAMTHYPMRQRSTLAHELGHVVFGDWADWEESEQGGRTPKEVRADTFARHLLAPIDGIREFVSQRPAQDLSALSAVVQRFLVSPGIAAISLRQAGYISDATKEEWMVLTAPGLAARFGWSDQYRALQADAKRRRAPQRLLARAIQGYLEQVVSLQTLATLRGVDTQTVEEELREAGLIQAEQTIRWADPAELPQVDVDMTNMEGTAEDPTR
jgi:Zn-dependent peptidase ImmA (M78 family)